MIKPIQSLFRRARAAVLVGGALVLLLGVVPLAGPGPAAAAASVATIQAQAQQIQAQIDSLGAKDGALSQQYDGAVLHVQQIDQAISTDQKKLAVADLQAHQAETALRNQAVQEFITGGGAVQVLNIVQGDASTLELRSQFIKSATHTENNALDQLRAARRVVAAQRAQLGTDQTQAKAILASVSQARQQVVATETQLQGVYAQVKGQLAVEIQAEEQARLKAEQAAAKARFLALAAAAAPAPAPVIAHTVPLVDAGTSSVTGNKGPSANSGQGAPSPVLPPANGAQRAVSAAESQVGTPYVWGGASPGGFDCSGLVLWAWGQAGVSLPHYTGSQYDVTTHIPLGSVQPGDLLFNADLSHVTMYVGGGMMVEAAHTGTNIRIVPVRSEMVLASRV